MTQDSPVRFASTLLLDTESPSLIDERDSEVLERLDTRALDCRQRVGVHSRAQCLLLSLAAGEHIKVLVAIVEEHSFGDSERISM